MNEKSREDLNSISQSIINAAITVHRALGPGLLESIYQECLIKELLIKKISFRTSIEIPIIYKEMKLDKKYIIDLVIEDSVIVELKAVEELLAVHEAQLLTYMRIMEKRVGLLINFNVPLLKQGIKRIVNKF